jgi:hypothetical protein
MAILWVDSVSPIIGASETASRTNVRNWISWSPNAGPKTLVGPFNDIATQHVYYEDVSATNANNHLDDRYTTIILGHRWKVLDPDNVPGATVFPLVYWLDNAQDDSGDPTYDIQASMGVTYSGEIVFYRGSTGGTELGRSAKHVIKFSDTWQYIEYKVTFSQTVGTADVRVNEVSVLSLTGLDNCFTAKEYCTNVLFPCMDITADTVSCDLYIADTTGAAPNNDFLGDIRVEHRLADGDGNRNDFTPLSGLTNYEMVDSTQVEDDTSYVSGSTAGDDDLYTFTNLSHTYTDINTVAVRLYGRNEDAGRRPVRAVCRSSVSESVGNTEYFNEDRYRYVQSFIHLDPNGSIAWTQSAVDAAEFGINIEA